MAKRVGISRTTLAAVEAGDPAPSVGTYLRVMSVPRSGGRPRPAGQRYVPAGAGGILPRRPPGALRHRSRYGSERISAAIRRRTCRVWRYTERQFD
ncbi:hypothetical protein M1D55_04580 [Cupriavidus sp. JZ107]|nr:hypothetical protein [Cupriavidus sp. HPC(L)]